MQPAVGAPARAYIRTGVIQKPVLRIRKYATLRYDAFYANNVKFRKLYTKWSSYFKGHI